jgi:hypothetical protein
MEHQKHRFFEFFCKKLDSKEFSPSSFDELNISGRIELSN